MQSILLPILICFSFYLIIYLFFFSLLPRSYGTVNLIRNLPLDQDLVATPNNDITPSNKATTSEMVLLLLSSALNSLPYINEGNC